MSECSGSGSGSESESELGMVMKRVRAMGLGLGQTGGGLKPRYTALDILSIQEKFKCTGGEDCPMLHLVSSAPEILRCRSNPPANKTGRPKQPLPYLNAKARSPSAAAIALRPSQPLSLNQRFTYLRNGHAPPSVLRPADSASDDSATGHVARLVAFTDADWL